MPFDEEPTARPGEPRRSQLRRILDETPRARRRIGRAVVSLGMTTLAAIVILGLLLIWHLIRRARLIRERLDSPKETRLVDPRANPTDEFTATET